jgi:hypothetical protein
VVNESWSSSCARLGLRALLGEGGLHRRGELAERDPGHGVLPTVAVDERDRGPVVAHRGAVARDVVHLDRLVPQRELEAPAIGLDLDGLQTGLAAEDAGGDDRLPALVVVHTQGEVVDGVGLQLETLVPVLVHRAVDHLLDLLEADRLDLAGTGAHREHAVAGVGVAGETLTEGLVDHRILVVVVVPRVDGAGRIQRVQEQRLGLGRRTGHVAALAEDRRGDVLGELLDGLDGSQPRVADGGVDLVPVRVERREEVPRLRLVAAQDRLDDGRVDALLGLLEVTVEVVVDVERHGLLPVALDADGDHRQLVVDVVLDVLDDLVGRAGGENEEKSGGDPELLGMNGGNGTRHDEVPLTEHRLGRAGHVVARLSERAKRYRSRKKASREVGIAHLSEAPLPTCHVVRERRDLVDDSACDWLNRSYLDRPDSHGGDVSDPLLFIPDDALQFRRLPMQYLTVQAMRGEFDRFKSRGYSSIETLYYAYVLQNPNHHNVATAVGANEFNRRMTEYLRQAQNMLESVIGRYLRPFAGRLDPHNSVANCLDPIAMLMMATEDLPSGASALQRQRRLEAMRQLAISLQLFAIETVDDESWVADDLSVIDQLSWDRLFLPNESKYLWAVVELETSPEKVGFPKSVEIFTRAKDKLRRLQELTRGGIPFKEELLSCRIANVKDARYYIYAVNRRKRLLSTLLKLERGRRSTDRRGWKYVVVAVQKEQGPLVLANVEDAQRFSAHTKATLWQLPLVEEFDESPFNPESDPRYKDEKIVGRFHRPDNGRVIAGSAEQITTTIMRHVDTLFARDGVNHYLYRARQIHRYLAPLWFPQRRDLFEGVDGLTLPGYGVDWGKPYFTKQLEEWWKTQL